MNIYIDNEEVLCASNMVIKEQLKNTSSVILNNVYPKSWETDKDYVSRFYMPKDYSHCVIKDDKTTKTTYSLIENINYIDNRYYRNGELRYENCKLVYFKMVIGQKYKIVATNNDTNYQFSFYQADSLNIGSPATLVKSLGAEETATFEVTATKKYLFATNRYYNLDPVITISKIEVECEDNLVFSGLIKNSGNINLNPRYPHYATLQLLDYKAFLSEGDTLNYVLSEQTVSSAIKNVVKNLDGFYIGEIKINDSNMSAYNCNEKSPYDVFEYLSEITGSIWYTKAINEKIVLISFYSVDNLEQKETIEYTQEYFNEKQIQDIKYSYNSKDYRNKQIIVSDKATSNITQVEYLTYNGTNLETQYPISSIVSIKKGNRSYSVGLLDAKYNGSFANFYYEYNSPKIDVNISLGTGTVLRVEYYSVVTSRQVSYNFTEIDRISEATNRNGIIARYEKRTDTSDENALAQISQTYLDYKGIPEIELVIKSYYKDLFNIGDKAFFNGPLADLKTTYLVVEKSIEMITTGEQQVIFYTYRLNSSFNDENAINYFDNQRRKLQGNLEEGSYIKRYIDFPSSTNIIFYDLSVNNVQIPGDILDGELDIELLGSSNLLNALLEFYL